MADTKVSIEEAFEEINRIIKEMEEKELPLAESMDLYKKGVLLLNQCKQTLDETEKELIILRGEDPGSQEEENDDAP